MHRTPTAIVVLLLCGLLTLGAIQPTEPQARTQVLYLVRHAEKAGEHGDPDLTPQGHNRAATLARMLGKADLQAVYATDYRRTRQTAAPSAAAHGLKTSSYDPRDKGLAERLAQQRGDVLVVGHSNTIPALLRSLGANYDAKLLEGYDDLFVVFRHTAADGTTTTRVATLQFTPTAEKE